MGYIERSPKFKAIVLTEAQIKVALLLERQVTRKVL